MFEANGKQQLRIKIILQDIIVDYEYSKFISTVGKFNYFLMENDLNSGTCRRIDFDNSINKSMKKLILSIINDYKSIDDYWYNIPLFYNKETTIEPRIKDLKHIQSNLPSEWELKWRLFKIRIKQFIK